MMRFLAISNSIFFGFMNFMMNYCEKLCRICLQGAGNFVTKINFISRINDGLYIFFIIRIDML